MHHNPIEKVEEISIEGTEMLRHLQELKGLEHFQTLFTEAEQTSVIELIKIMNAKVAGVNTVLHQLKRTESIDL